LESIDKYITLLAQDMSDLSPRQRTAKMEAGQAQYLYSLLNAGVTVNFVEYLCGTIEEMDKQRLTRIRQKRFQLAKRQGHFSKAFTTCRVCGARLMREYEGKLVETQTMYKHRAFCSDSLCKKEGRKSCRKMLIATKPVRRVVKVQAVPQPLDISLLPVGEWDMLRDELDTASTRRAPKHRKTKSPRKLRRDIAKSRRSRVLRHDRFNDQQIATFAAQLVDETTKHRMARMTKRKDATVHRMSSTGV